MSSFSLFESTNIFFTSDTHFGHKNIISLCKRPYKNRFDMKEKMISAWNEKVPPNGIVFHAGDFGFKLQLNDAEEIMQRLNGQIHLISGNHDQYLLGFSKYRESFASVQNYLRIRVLIEGGKEQNIVINHYPLEEWDGFYHGVWHCYGHTHRALASDAGLFRAHIGVDGNGFVPLSYPEMASLILTNKQKKMEKKKND